MAGCVIRTFYIEYRKCAASGLCSVVLMSVSALKWLDVCGLFSALGLKFRVCYVIVGILLRCFCICFNRKNKCERMMNPIKLFCLMTGALIISYLPTVSAVPVIGISSMYDVLTPGTQSMTKRIYNTGNTTAFVRIDLFEVYPGKKTTARELPQKEIMGNTLEKDRLIVTPLRMIIPPSGFQAVRILWPGDRGIERYYRVRFTPVMPDGSDDFGLDEKTRNEYRKSTLQAGINVLTGYGTVVIIQPDNPFFNSKIDASRHDVISITNNGNTTISLDNIRYCKSTDVDCGAVTREFVLPEKSKNIEKRVGYTTSFTLIEGNNKKGLTY